MKRATTDEKVKAYLQLREAIAEEKQRSQRRIKALQADQNILEDSLRKELLNVEAETGKASISARHGSVFFTVREGFKVSDREAFDLAVENGEVSVSMFSNTISKEEVKAYMDVKRADLEKRGVDVSKVSVEKLLPPGVIHSEFHEVSVRKAN